MVPQSHGGVIQNWNKGTSGNPRGRPAGLVAYARKQTQDGKELVDFMLSVLRRSGEFATGRKRPDLRTRMEAATWLADQAFGKPVQRTEVTGEGGGPVQVEDVSARAAVLALIERRLEAEALAIDVDVVTSFPGAGGDGDDGDPTKIGSA